MPELPDITVYMEAMRERMSGRTLRQVRRNSPFLLRTVEPGPDEAHGRRVVEIRRIGKRIAIGLDNGIWLVLHLMIAGRLHWRKPAASLGAKTSLAAFDFDHGSLVLTEAGAKKRASLHVMADAELHSLDPGGLEVMDCGLPEFRDRLRERNHTLKRALTDPRIFSGIGNAYSDEILLAAGLSPVAMSQSLDGEEVSRLFDAVREQLDLWIGRLRKERGDAFPGKVTAFRDEMAAHGKFGQPCPRCGTEIQRIRHAANETNYCPRCQTGGKLLADRSLSRLLRKDWPRTIEELEQRTSRDPAL